MALTSSEQPIKNGLLARIKAMNESGEKRVIKTNARRTKVTEEFVGHTLSVFNGREYKTLRITEEMERKTLAKLVPRHSHTAGLRYVSIPPRKMRLVANMVKGLPIEKALDVLNFTPRIAAKHIANTLKSAAANRLSIEGTDSLRPEDLYVKEITVQAAPSAKRIRFQSMGRVFRYKKRHCHLSILLEERKRPAAAVATKTAAKGKAGATERKAAPKKKKAATKKPTAKQAATKKTKSTAKAKQGSDKSAKAKKSEK